MRTYLKNLYTTKVENWKERDNSLDSYHLPKLYQDEINNLGSSVIPKGIKELITRLPTKETKGC